MREATGNALLVTMVTSIIAIIMIFFVGSLSYSKSYRVKNYIINQIEENRGWDNKIQKDVIDPYLKDIGYNVVKGTSKCGTDSKCGTAINSNDRQYEYCIYKCGSASRPHYKVITYMKFDFPVIGDTIKLQVKGETKTFNDFN